MQSPPVLPIRKSTQTSSHHKFYSLCNFVFLSTVSLNLKKSPFMDAMLAAKKVSVDSARVNLYPKGDSLERVRRALEDSLDRAGVTVLTETSLDAFDAETGTARGSGAEIGFGRVIFGTDIRETERIFWDEAGC